MKEHQLDTPFSKEQASLLCAGDKVLLSGTIYTARDAAHKRLFSLIKEGKNLPVDLTDQVIYYVGPTPKKPGAISGSAGPTTSCRMDSYTPALMEKAGLRAMIGKGNRSFDVINSIVENCCVYFAAIGGAGALIAKSIVKSSIVAYKDLGPEAIHLLEIREMPVIVAIDTTGANLYETGPASYSTFSKPAKI